MNDRPSQRYWKSNIALIRNLLSIWALVSIGASILFVEPLNTIEIGQIPLGFGSHNKEQFLPSWCWCLFMQFAWTNWKDDPGEIAIAISPKSV